jgi:hypothetical protein
MASRSRAYRTGGDMHDFKSSLVAGQVGEALFQSLTGFKKLSGYQSDFLDESTNETYELKTDSYTLEKTKNFFIELYSNVDKGTLGGPKQAASHGSKYWVYLYAASKVYYVFNTLELIAELDRLSSEQVFKRINIPNRSWTTVGILVPRALLTPIAREVKYK